MTLLSFLQSLLRPTASYADAATVQRSSPGWGLQPGESAPAGSWAAAYWNAVMRGEGPGAAASDPIPVTLAGRGGGGGRHGGRGWGAPYYEPTSECDDPPCSVAGDWQALSAMHAGHPDRPQAILGRRARRIVVRF
jgi:hypothetical protein